MDVKGQVLTVTAPSKGWGRKISIFHVLLCLLRSFSYVYILNFTPLFLTMKTFRLLFLAAAANSVAAVDCFYPDGVTTDPNHVPCNSTISTSSCCDPLDSCTNSGLCLGRTGFNYRGSCTDKTWTSANCASECLAGNGCLREREVKKLTFSLNVDPFNKDPYDSFTALFPCGLGGQFSGKYCCDSPNRNCCTIATFDYGTTGSAFKPGMDKLFQELASFSANSSGAVTTTVTITATGSQATNAPNSSISSSASSSAASSSIIGTAVGAGVGVPLGILAVGILGFLFYRERRHSHFSDQSTTSRSNILEMEPPKDYYHPPPQPPQPYVPFVEAGGQTPIQSNDGVARTLSTQKTPGYNGPPSNVHEMI